MKKNITDKKLKKLGFEKQVETAESSGNDEGFHYYTLDIGTICLISCSDDECNGGYSIEFYDHPNACYFTNHKKLKKLIKILRDNRVTR